MSKNNREPGASFINYGDFNRIMSFLSSAEGFVPGVYGDKGNGQGVLTSGYGFTGPWLEEHRKRGFTRESAGEIMHKYLSGRDKDFTKNLPGYANAPRHIKDAALFYSYTRPMFYKSKDSTSQWIKNAIATGDLTGIDTALTLGTSDPLTGKGLKRRWNALADLMVNGNYRQNIYTDTPVDYSKLGVTTSMYDTPDGQYPAMYSQPQQVIVNQAPPQAQTQDYSLTPEERKALLDIPMRQAQEAEELRKREELNAIQREAMAITKMYTDLLPRRTRIKDASLFAYGGNTGAYPSLGLPSFDTPINISLTKDIGFHADLGHKLRSIMPLTQIPGQDVGLGIGSYLNQSLKANLGKAVPTTPIPKYISPIHKIGAVAGIAGAGIAGFNSASSIADTSGRESSIQQTANTKFNAEDNDGLIDEWGGINFQKHVALDEVRGNRPGLGGALGTAISGAGAGSVFGPIGAAIGGGIGFLGSAIGDVFGNSKAHDKMVQLNRDADNANAQVVTNFASRAEAVDKMNDTKLRKNFFAEGGEASSAIGDFNEYNEGGTHEENPLGGIPIGIGANGAPNLVEEGESNYNGYIFSNRLKPIDKAFLSAFGLPESYADMTFAEISKRLMREGEERPNDPISRKTTKDLMTKLTSAQEEVKMRKEIERMKAMGIDPMQALQAMQGQAMQGNMFAEGGEERKAPKDNPLSVMRYVPALGSAIGVATDLLGITNRPDYSLLDGYDSYVRSMANKTGATAKDFTGHVDYRPMDINYQANALRSQSASTSNAIKEQSGANPHQAMAGLLSNGYRGQLGLAQMYRDAHEKDFADRMRVADFNRSTHHMNQSSRMQAQQFNNSLFSQKGDALMRLAQLRDAERQRSYAGRSANLTNLFNSLGDIGREFFIFNQINRNPALYYAQSVLGGMDKK